MLVLKLIALLVFLFVPGYLVVSLFLGEKSDENEESKIGGSEQVFLSAVCGCGMVALLGMILGLMGRFGFPALLLAWIILCMALFFFARRRLAWISRVGWREWAALALLAVVGLVVFLPPGRVVFGWNDDGVYTNIAARMQREGDIHMQVDVVGEVAPERRELVFTPNGDSRNDFEAFLYKQYFITDYTSGKVEPQFFYLWPSLMAVFAAFLGLGRMFYAVSVMSLLSLWGIYLLARRMLGRRWPWVTTLLVVLSPLMIYFAKYTTSEMVTMALFLAATLALLVYLEEAPRSRSINEATLSALLFTLCFLARIDMCMVLPPLLIYLFWKRVSSTWSRADTVFILFTLAGFGIALLVGRLTSGPYFSTIFNYSFEGTRKILIILLAFTGILCALFFCFPRALRGPAVYLADRKRLWTIMTWVFLAAVFVILYFIRPAIGDHDYISYGIINATQGLSLNSQNLIRWGWYLSFPGLLLVFIGYGLAATTGHRRSWSPVLAMGFFATLFYAWSMHCTPLQIMVMRRLMPVVLPLAMIMIVYTLACLWRQPYPRKSSLPLRVLWPLGKLVAAMLLFYLVVFSLGVSWQIFGLREGGNQREVVAEVSSATMDGTVLMDSNAGDLFGPPLLALEGRSNAWLAENSALIDERFPALLGDLGFPARPVYLLWRPSLSGSEVGLAKGLALEPVEEVVWHEENLETSFEHRPDQRIIIDEPFEIYRIIPSD